MIQQQITIELRERELITYNQNAELIQKNAELTTGYQTKAVELRQYEKGDRDLSQVLQNIAVELPQCNLEPELPVTQKVRRIAEREKDLEEEKVRLEAKY